MSLHRSFLSLFLLLSSVAVSCSISASDGTVHKLMTYNVRNGIGIDDSVSVRRVADAIVRQAPEIVAVQELDSVTGRSQGRYVLGDIGKMTGMYPCYSPAIDYDGGRYGIGVLCRTEPLSVHRYSLPGEEEARAMIVVEMTDYMFACTHMSLTDADRMRSLDIIRSVASESYSATHKPFFIAGDFNSHPDSEFIKALMVEFTPLTDTTVPTFPADIPDETLDYIILYAPSVTGPVKSGSSVVNEPSASDHRPVVTVVTLPDTSRRS